MGLKQVIRNITAIWERLITPHSNIQSPEQYQQAGVLASLTLVLALVSLILAPTPFLYDLSIPLLDSRGVAYLLTALFLLFLYQLSRRGHVRLVTYLIIAYGSPIVFLQALIIAEPTNLHVLDYLVVLIVFASLFLSMRQTALILAAQLIGILLFPMIHPEISLREIIQEPFIFNLMVGILILIFAHYREHQESIRQAILRESEARYRGLVENIRDMVYVIDERQQFMSINAVVENILGWSADEFIHQPLNVLIHPQDLPYVYEFFGEPLPEDGSELYKLRVRSKSGAYLWVELTAAPRIIDGEYRGVFGVARDITDRQQTEDALRESESKFRRFVEQSSDGIVLADEKGYIIEWNRSQEALTGITREEVVGSPLIETLRRFVVMPSQSPELQRRVEMMMRNMLQTGQVPGNEREQQGLVSHKNGTMSYVHTKYFVIPTEHGHMLASIARDITAHKQAEAQKLQLALEQQRMSLVGDFTLAMSHDFRTSLSHIETSRYLIGRTLPPAERERVAPKLDQIQRSITHMETQLENLQRMFATTHLDLTPRDLNDLVKQAVVEQVDLARQKNITLTAVPSGDLPPVMADHQQLKWAIKHLLVNAINYNRPDGTIRVRAYQKVNRVCVEVQDTGIGIQPENQSRVFDLFYRENPARTTATGGVGLGLTIVKLIIEAHDGQIALVSKPGQGTTFTISLPVLTVAQKPSKNTVQML